MPVRDVEKDKANALEIEALSEAIVALKDKAASASRSCDDAMRGQRSAISERDAYAAELTTLKADYANLQAKYDVLVAEQARASEAQRYTIPCSMVVEVHMDDNTLEKIGFQLTNDVERDVKETPVPPLRSLPCR